MVTISIKQLSQYHVIRHIAFGKLGKAMNIQNYVQHVFTHKIPYILDLQSLLCYTDSTWICAADMSWIGDTGTSYLSCLWLS